MNKVLTNITGSEIIKISQKIKQASHPVFNLSIGDFDPKINAIPELLKKYIKEEYDNDSTNYPMAQGELVLREAIAKNSLYTADEILVGAGARPLIYTLFKGIVDPGDYVVYPVPSWNNNHYCFLHGANAIEIECKPENDFFPTVEDIQKELYRAKLICLCSPQNPTGKLIDRYVLRDICKSIVEVNKHKENKTYLFFDQIYSDLAAVTFTDPLEVCPEIKPYLLSIDGVSKSICATGLRVGWMTGPKDVIAKMTSVFSHIGAWAPKPEQLAVAKYLHTQEMFEFVNTKVFQYGEIMEEFCEFLNKLKALNYKIDYKEPDAGIYLSLYLGYQDNFKTLDEYVDFLIDNGLGIVPFEYFGSKENKGWFRISIGTVDQDSLDDIFYTLATILRKLENEY
jgi:aspartate aminotransferase